MRDSLRAIGWASVVLALACGNSPQNSPQRSADSSSGSSSASAPTSAAPAPLSRVQVKGTAFVLQDGKPFEWRGITAFRLLDYVADGDESRADAYLAWAAQQRLTVVRVLSMVDGFFDLKPEQGRAALPRLLALAAKHGIRIELVTLAATSTIPVNFDEHVRESGRIMSAHGGGFLELANEPGHPTQHTSVHQPAFLRTLAATVPADVVTALGSIEWGDGFADGAYVTWHVPRSTDREGWGHVLAIARGSELIARWGKPVVSDEPIGAGPIFQAGRRDDNPARFRAAALLTRFAGLGATFHYEGGLQAVIPEGRELECFRAWNEAWSLLPDDIGTRGAFREAGKSGSATLASDAALAMYERTTASDGWVLVLGKPTGDLQLASGWVVAETRDFEGVRLVRLIRRSA